MILLNLCGHDFHYEAENIVRVFYPDEQIRVVYDSDEDGCLTSRMARDGANWVLSAEWNGEEARETMPAGTPNPAERQELLMATALYRLLCRRTDYIPAWGILTGVRPSKLMHTLVRSMGADGAKAYFRNTLLVSESKTELAYAVAQREAPVLASSKCDSYSLYLSVPFCPSRCSYCSFVSHSIAGAGAKKLIEPYVDLLCKELRQTGEIASDLRLHPQSVYIGGGTPGVLTAEQLTRVCTAVAESFPLGEAREFTVEIGRPDTVTADKLDALHKAHVTRISINPQTLNDDVLAHIGRRHTAAQTLDAFHLAREMGFDNINMDLIAGLETDTPDSFRRTLEDVLALGPENITVHTLALKRSSRMVTEDKAAASGGQAVAQMLEDAQRMCTAGGYAPYYMYRQTRSVGNFENVGWCRPGYEGVYNIFMMEEQHTVLACGAGAVTKLRDPGSNHLERIFNFKYPYEYISRFDELTARKARIKSFYGEYVITEPQRK